MINRIKKFFASILELKYIGLADIVGSGLGSLFWFIIAAIVGVEDYGRIGFILATAGILSTLSQVGTSTTITVLIAKNIKIQSSTYLVAILGTIISSIAIIFITGDVNIAILIPAFVVFNLSISELIGLQRFRTYAIYILSQKALMFFLGIAFFYIFGYQGVIFGIAISNLPHGLRLIGVFRNAKIDFKLLKEKFRFLMNNFMLDISTELVSSFDKLIIVPLFGFVMLGNYQLSVQFLTMLFVIPNVFYKYILSIESSGKTSSNLPRLLIISSGIMAILGFIFGPMLLPRLFPNFTDAGNFIQILSLAVIPNSINSIYIAKLMSREQNKIVLGGSISFIIIQLLLIMILGNFIGIIGVSSSLVIAEAAKTIYFIVITKKTNFANKIKNQYNDW